MLQVLAIIHCTCTTTYHQAIVLVAGTKASLPTSNQVYEDVHGRIGSLLKTIVHENKTIRTNESNRINRIESLVAKIQVKKQVPYVHNIIITIISLHSLKMYLLFLLAYASSRK
jgi:hypothetical protein